MQIVRRREELARARKEIDGSLALIPTMGALHDGHLALIAEGKKRADTVAATIFVNPTQFNDPKDLERYPRNEQADLAKLEAAGCDLVWLPEVGDIYPDGFATTVSVAGISDRWEGEHRPGHFDGVATVVARLLLAATPDVAIFGEKDWQQLAVIRRMVQDLGLAVTIVGMATVRESDGLAMSSRNALLNPEERARAVALPQALAHARRRLLDGADAAPVIDEARQTIQSAGFGPVDYLALVDGATLVPIERPQTGARLIAAAFLGAVRLIDNLAV